MDLILDLPIPKRKARLFYQWSGFELHIEQGEYGYINIGNEIGKNLTCNDYGIRDRLSVGDIMIIGDNQLHLEVVELREDAIRYAINNSIKNDVILIAGKGAENYQEIFGIKKLYNDKDTVKGILGLS